MKPAAFNHLLNIGRKSQTTLTLIVSLLICFGTVKATRDSDHRADGNMRSNARVNPATFAMEFSLPLSGYAGRSGNSTPVSLSYSSKVWTMRQFDYRGRMLSGQGTQFLPFLYTYITSVMPYYAERSRSGWTSSLRPISIVPEVESFIWDGEVGNTESTCQLIDEQWINNDPSCPFGRHIRVYSCPAENELPGAVITFDTCNTDPGGGTPGPWPSPSPFPVPDYKVKRLRIQMPDGTTQEFRKDDEVYDCNLVPCIPDEGSYLSVDGSGMKLVVGTPINPSGESTLFLPDGSRYHFKTFEGTDQRYIDKYGNVTLYDGETKTWTETLGRQITDPFPSNLEVPTLGTTPFQLPGVENQPITYSQKWEMLKPDSCVTGSEASCSESALENVSDSLYSQGNDTCLDRDNDNPTSNPRLFIADPTHTEQVITQTHPQRWYLNTYKYRICGGLFNPIVLHETTLADGSKYKFRYNRYGEITKIIHPTGAYERFVYAMVPALSGMTGPYNQGNRGVVQRYLSEDGVTETQIWTYGSDPQLFGIGNVVDAPDGSRTQTTYSNGGGYLFGFEDPLAGKPVDERVYTKPLNAGNPNSREILKRTKWDYVVAPPRSGGVGPQGTRDARTKRSVSIVFEPGSGYALAKLSTIEYDDAGSSDPEFFSHLNAKRQKAYHFASVPKATAEDPALTWATIEGWFPSSKLASVTETDYSYDSAYKARGILGRPVETRVLNPANPSDVLAKTQYVYDESQYFDNSYTTTNWEDPNSNLRGNVTTTRTWVKETDTWLESHTMYDNFGNVRKVWDASGDVNKFVETQYDPTYKYAYPTKVISPAPDPSNTTGTNQTSTVETTYDFTTGLPLSVKDEFGQITKTEYDASLRPVRVYADNFTAPESQTIYGVPDSNGQYPANQRFVKVRKQIDANNWDEAITWADGLGRTIKTQAKDSQGDVFVETVYDSFGRVERVTNPFRQGDTVYWSKTRYDEMGRAVETYAPATLADITANNLTSLGVTSFNISTVPNFVGTVVTTTDASGRKGRSITNALGQLLRVDEPTAISGTETNDLGALATPNQPTSYKYDLYGKMVEVTQGIQKRFFKYDSLGRLIRVKQPEQEVNTALNLADSFNTSGQWTAGFTYDVLGNVLTATDANGVTITNTYDRAGRVKTRSYSDSTPAVSFYYDGKGLSAPQTPNYAKGKLTKVTSSVSATEYQLFDNLGRMTQMAQITDGRTYTSKYTYNFSGALVEEEYPSGRKVKNEFESDGDLLKVSSQKNSSSVYAPYASNFSYTASGGISQMKLGNGRWETAKFNTRLQVEELGLGSSATNASLWKTNYQYGELNTSTGNVDSGKNTGNIARQTLTVPGSSFVQNYEYDSLYRLKVATEKTGSTQNWTQSWNYDRYGNRVGFAQNVAGLTNAPNPTVNASTNRFELNQGFSYDKNGNVISDVDPVTSSARTFVFNGDNKQTEVKRGSEVVGRYFYDGEGKRIKKQRYAGGVLAEETVFVYSSGKLVAEYSNQVSQTPTVAYTTTDHLGSPRIITNQLGQVKSRRDFMPFGEDIFENVGAARTAALNYSSNQDDLRQKFTGYQKDSETQLDFAEARMYENRFGRFTAVDPLLASGRSGNPQTFNRYVYVSNRPMSLTDPTGLDPWWRGNCSNGRCEYKESKTKPTEGDWKEVDFKGQWYTTVDQWNNTGQTAFLYKSGGQDMGRRYQVEQDLASFYAKYSAIDPKQIAVRDEQVRNGAAAVMWSGAAILNKPLETYNAGAWVGNRFGFSLPYAPTIQPDENTGSGGKLFYYGTNGALLFQGLASSINALRGGGTFYRSMSNAEYAALQKSGGLTYMPGKELFVSSSASYSRAYLTKPGYDVLVQFNMRSGATNFFNRVGVAHRTAAGSSGWAARGNLLWKPEQGVMNLGIQSNTHLFNPLIRNFKVIE